ncbi:MAG: SusC/RagA family TonB-linked outer membrane protein [Bacteroides sp.]
MKYLGTHAKPLVLLFLLCLIPIGMAAQSLVKGTVKDSAGEPVIGAAVQVVSTKVGSITDSDGRFSVKASPNDKLQISFVGYKTETVALKGRTSIEVILQEDDIMLNDVVVVGYGTAKKSDLSGSVASLDTKEMMKRNPLNIAQGLQGAAPGVVVTRTSGDPSGQTTVRIRGIATINGSASPLYVVNGVQVGTNADFVNPADVERIEVLKDASATAIYGAQGANGVILITTKQGVKGQTRINFGANFGIQQMRGKIDVADANLFAYSVRQGRANDNVQISNLAFGENYQGKLNSFDWQDIMTQTALQQNYTLSATGGTERTQSTLSVGYMDNEGVVVDSKYKRLTARASSIHKANDFIEVGGNLAFKHEEKWSKGNLKDWAILTPTMDYVDPVTGEFVSQPSYKQRADGTWPVYLQVNDSNHDLPRTLDNPYASIVTQDHTPEYYNTLLADAYIELKLLKGLSFKSIGSYRLTTYDASEFLYATKERYEGGYGENSFSLNQSQSNNLRLENYFTYNLKLGKHNATLMAGNSISNEWGHQVYAKGFNFYSDDYRQLNLAGDTSKNQGDGKYELSTRYASWFGRLMYSFNDRYILTASVRRDGSSNFGENNRWGTFPSAAVAWRLSEEEFIKNLNVFDNLKLRIGWGRTGNAGSATSKGVNQLSTYRISYDWGKLDGPATDYTKVQGVAQFYAIDTNLKWETNEQTNFGLDMAFLKGELTVTMDYFIRKTKDLLLNRQIRPSSGHSRVYTNYGNIENKGFELGIGYNKRLGDWTLGAQFNATHIKNKVTTMEAQIGSGLYGLDTQDNSWYDHNIAKEGYAIGTYWGYQVDHIYQSQAEIDADNEMAKSKGFSAYNSTSTQPGDFRYKDLNGDGHISSDDKTDLGNGFPTLNYSLTLNAAYKNFDVMVYGYGVLGMDILSYSSARLTQLCRSTGGISNTLKEYINGAWTPENPTAKYPRMTVSDPNGNKQISSAYVKKGDYLKIANIQVGYTLPRKVAGSLKLQNARIYVAAENIACISGYNKWGDPEIGNASQDGILSTGFDSGRYPYPRQFTMGLNIQF